MPIISIWTRSALALQDVAPYRFVTPFGQLGGNSGISNYGARKNHAVDIITLGEAEVEVAPDQNISIGDFVVGDENGYAVKSELGLLVLSIHGNKNITVLVR